MTTLDRIVVVGASLAGLRTAQALRRRGHTGELVLVGDEPHLPYDRPPLSKQLLSGAWTRPRLDLPLPADLDVRWVLGTRTEGLDVPGRRVHLAGGQSLGFDGLVIATGSRARPWPTPVPDGALTIRTADDSAALATRLATADRLLVVGAGFLGSEIAATARALGLPVTLVEPRAQPLLTAAGPAVGAFVADLHRQSGIALHLDTGVAAFTADPAGGLTGATLTNGQHVRASVAVLALGALPNTEWLTSSGLALDHGLVCDRRCRALHADGSPTEHITAAGDVVRWTHPLTGGALLSLGHWTNATEQADAAARALLDPDSTPPFVPLPSFWSDLHDAKIRSVGLPHLATAHTVVEHDTTRRRLVVTYQQHGQLIGAITVNRTSRLAGYRQALQHHLDTSTPAGQELRPVP